MQNTGREIRSKMDSIRRLCVFARPDVAGPLELGREMEVRWAVLPEEHADDHSVEAADLGHISSRCRAPGKHTPAGEIRQVDFVRRPV